MRERNDDKPGIATSLNNIAEVLFRAGDLNGAAERYRQSLEQFDKLGARNAAARNVLSLAEVAFERKEMSAAESQALQAMKEFQNPDRQDPDSEQAAAALLIKIYIAEGKPQAAAPYVQRIRQKPSSEPEVMFSSRLSVAEYLSVTGKSKEAEDQLKGVAAQAEAAGLHFVALEARLQLAYLLGKNGSHFRRTESSRRCARRRGRWDSTCCWVKRRQQESMPAPLLCYHTSAVMRALKPPYDGVQTLISRIDLCQARSSLTCQAFERQCCHHPAKLLFEWRAHATSPSCYPALPVARRNADVGRTWGRSDGRLGKSADSGCNAQHAASGQPRHAAVERSAANHCQGTCARRVARRLAAESRLEQPIKGRATRAASQQTLVDLITGSFVIRSSRSPSPAASTRFEPLTR